MSLVRHGEEIRCKCGGELNPVAHSADGESRFRFAMTHRRDGSPIKNLETKGAVLGTIEAALCTVCGTEQAVLDSVDEAEEWNKLPNWHTQQ